MAAQLEIEKGTIERIYNYGTGPVDHDYGDKRILPGFIDIHTHGAYDFDTNDGEPEGLRNWMKRIPEEGVTSILPTTALMLVMNISGIMDAGFEQVYTMMRANAEFEETQIILGTYLYNISVVNRTNIPFATALGVFNGLIALLLMLVGNLITTKTMKRSLW